MWWQPQPTLIETPKLELKIRWCFLIWYNTNLSPTFCCATVSGSNMMSIDSNGINPIYFKNDSWLQSRDYVVATPATKNPIKRLKIVNNGATVFGGGSYTYRNSGDNTGIFSIDNTGNTQKVLH